MERSTPSNRLWFQSVDLLFTVCIGPDAMLQMLELCRRSGGLETGGVLIGRYSEDRRVAYVDMATGPGSDSRAGGSWFVRGVRGLQQMLNTMWTQKRGYYIGEWHFHPGAAPLPSRQDETQMQSIARSKLYQCPEPLLIIVGGYPDGSYALHAEVHTRSGQRSILTMSSEVVAMTNSLLMHQWA